VAAGSAAATGYDTCRWCSRDWHGLLCQRTSCDCESAMTCRDDSWRPRCDPLADRARWVMHETGCDGWTASLAAGDRAAVTGAGPFRAARLTSQLYGTARRAGLAGMITS